MILIAKANSYLTDDNDESERGKKKKIVKKTEL